MKMIKYIGILLLSGSISCYGVIISSRIMQAFRLRSEITELLQSIERSIVYGKAPINTVICDFNTPELKKTEFCKRICDCDNPEQVIEETLSILSGEDKKILLSFFTCLGKTRSIEDVKKNCRHVTDYFEKTQTESVSSISSKAVLYRKISLISALLVAIIFI